MGELPNATEVSSKERNTYTGKKQKIPEVRMGPNSCRNNARNKVNIIKSILGLYQERETEENSSAILAWQPLLARKRGSLLGLKRSFPSHKITKSCFMTPRHSLHGISNLLFFTVRGVFFHQVQSFRQLIIAQLTVKQKAVYGTRRFIAAL
jgi:hypothetical protein